MFPLVFLGGAIAGAAGLVTAALLDDKKTESAFPPLLKTPEHLDEEDVSSLLGDYALKANMLSIKCSDVEVKSCDLQSTSLELPDDSMFQKIANTVCNGLTRTCRGIRCGELNALKEEAAKLYGRYKGIFRRANALLRERGRSPLDLRPLRFSVEKITVNNALENDDWCLDFDEAVDVIRDFLQKSSDMAEEFIAIFEGTEKRFALGPGNDASPLEASGA